MLKQVSVKWKCVRLGDLIIDLKGGGTPSTTNPDFWDGNIPWTRSAAIRSRYITNGERMITREGLENSATNLIPKDNLLVATRVSIGNVGINKIDIAISQDLTGIIVDKSKVLAEYLYWFLLKSKQLLKSLAQGSTIKGITKDDLKSIELPLPSLEEQQKIASILSKGDDVVQKTDDIIEQTQRLKKGLMQKLFTKGIGHTAFRATAKGEIAANWSIKKLEDVCVNPSGILTGPFGSQLHEDDYQESGTPIITVEHLVDNRIQRNNLPYVSDEDYKRLSRYSMQEGDIVFSRVGAVDRCALITKAEDGWLFSGRCLRIRPNQSKICSEFLSWYFTFPQFRYYIRSRAVGATMPSLNVEIMKNTEVVVPPLSEQIEIARILSSTELLRKHEIQKRRALEMLKKGLMQKLFTGQIRVKV